jgi:hypothetical protein
MLEHRGHSREPEGYLSKIITMTSPEVWETDISLIRPCYADYVQMTDTVDFSDATIYFLDFPDVPKKKENRACAAAARRVGKVSAGAATGAGEDGRCEGKAAQPLQMTIVYDAERPFYRILFRSGSAFPLVLKSMFFWLEIALHIALLLIDRLVSPCHFPEAFRSLSSSCDGVSGSAGSGEDDDSNGEGVVGALPALHWSATATVTALLTFFIVFYNSQCVARTNMFWEQYASTPRPAPRRMRCPWIRHVYAHVCTQSTMAQTLTHTPTTHLHLRRCYGLAGLTIDWAASVRNHFPADPLLQWNVTRLVLASKVRDMSPLPDSARGGEILSTFCEHARRSCDMEALLTHVAQAPHTTFVAVCAPSCARSMCSTTRSMRAPAARR